MTWEAVQDMDYEERFWHLRRLKRQLEKELAEAKKK